MDWVFYLIKFIVAFIILNLALVAMSYLVYFERKVAAHMQARMGPNRAGPIGLFQSFADALKLLTKEDTIITGADKPVFWVAPIISFFAALGALAVIPFGPPGIDPGWFGATWDWFISDSNVGALVILALSSLGVYGIITAG